MASANLILGDCIEKMKDLPSESVDAVITDPPYGLEFMGKDWDSWDRRDHLEESKKNEGVGTFLRAGKNLRAYTAGQSFQDWCKLWATEALRVLKTGGFMFAMGGTRTHHRLTCGIEDAGFLIRDELCWVYLQGFPKAQDLAGMISKREGAVREGAVREGAGSEGNTFPLKPEYREYVLTENGKQWQGWKTPALKPAFEPIVVAQKPCEGSITENVMKHGVGGYNIDECRIPYNDKDDKQGAVWGHQTGGITSFETIWAQGEWNVLASEKGRYPSNLLMQEECFGKLSKFFLIPKASKGEKEENINGIEGSREWGAYGNGIGNVPKEGNLRPTTTNIHPTVKPVALMQHLIKLTTKPLYTVLDPFLGSGTTAVAALQLNRNIIGIEISEDYMKIAKARISEEVKQKRLFE